MQASILMHDEHGLSRLTEELAARSASLPPDYVRGKTWIRDTLLELADDGSMADAEAIVERLEAQGFIRFAGDPGSLKPPAGWSFHPRSGK